MDEWITAYLENWQYEFSSWPDASDCLALLKTIFAEIKRLPRESSFSADDLSIYDDISNSIISSITTLPDPDVGLDYIQDVLFDAATSSPLSSDPTSLTLLTQQLIANLPDPLDEKLQTGLTYDIRARWKIGPEKPTFGDPVPESEYIAKWVCLNRFVAHLTRLRVLLEQGDVKFGVSTLDRAFNAQVAGYREDERAYHVPAAATWIEVLGVEIYRWVVKGEGDSGLAGDGAKWKVWREGFEAVSRDDGLKLEGDAGDRAKRAFERMGEIQGQE
ncbi:hypothetical protein BJY04DRAFT_187631 [Aspergillus karnatakaensis]|uniref:uncharacterized protein n=1 Tax=Aspergillus karnatakaensis TaxID=1810916 RepID=UPI003CCE33E1